MPQEESPLIAGARKIYNKLDEWGANKDLGGKDTTDYSWHAQKVAEANKSHADAEKRGTTLKTIGAATTKKPPAKRRSKPGTGK